MSHHIKFERKADYSNRFEAEITTEGTISTVDQTTIATAIDTIRQTMEPYFRKIEQSKIQVQVREEKQHDQL